VRRIAGGVLGRTAICDSDTGFQRCWVFSAMTLQSTEIIRVDLSRWRDAIAKTLDGGAKDRGTRYRGDWTWRRNTSDTKGQWKTGHAWRMIHTSITWISLHDGHDFASEPR
jgi:hypothetical protein